MTTKETIQSAESPTFREMEPIELWSAKLTFTMPYADFEQKVSTIAQRVGQGFTGFISTDDDGNVTSFTSTRYPRKKYGIASLEDCQLKTSALSEELGATLQVEEHNDSIRVVLGLLEGYDSEAPTHDVDEIHQELSEARVTPAQVFAVRLNEDGTSVYTEPVAVIETSAHSLNNIYQLADRFKQERFTVEDFNNQTAHVVETRYCSEPD